MKNVRHTELWVPSLRRALLAAPLGLVLLAVAACSPESEAVEGPRIFATTGYLADAASAIAPDAQITTMVGPGGDPHTYQPSTRDITTLREADAVLWNGLDLEAQMTGQLESLGAAQIAVGEEIDPELLLPWPDRDAQGEPLHDPHIWNSPTAWSQAVGIIAEHLARIDPPAAEDYRDRAAGYQEEIAAADRAAEDLVATIPAERRTLVTGHDAFAYFGDTYGLEVLATDVISSEGQLSARRLSELADLIVDREVPVIFQDNQANPQAITSLREAVADRGRTVVISEAELYADSLGAEPGVDTYLGVFGHNAEAIAAALGEPSREHEPTPEASEEEKS